MSNSQIVSVLTTFFPPFQRIHLLSQRNFVKLLTQIYFGILLEYFGLRCVATHVQWHASTSSRSIFNI